MLIVFTFFKEKQNMPNFFNTTFKKISKNLFGFTNFTWHS